MGNSYDHAPILKFNGTKERVKNEQFYKIPQSLADCIFNTLRDSSAQIRIMMVLVGTKEGFGVSEKWIRDRTGISHESYNRARKELVKRNWLSHVKETSITVNYDEIYNSIEHHDKA